MPDITMCSNTKCSRRKDCYRYRAFLSPLQQTFTNFECDTGADFFYAANDSCQDIAKADNFWRETALQKS